MKTAKRRISILFIVILCNLCAQVTASTGAYEGVVTSVDGCEGGFDNGKHKAGEWRWYCNGWRYLYPGYHEVTLRKREAGYATDKIVVTADHAFQPSGTGPAASPQESDGKKAHVGKDGMVVAEAENYASLDDRGHGGNYAKGSSYKGFTGSGYVISPKGDNKSWADGPEVAMQGEPQDTKVIPSFDYVATNLGRRERAAWRTSGYLEAPRDGWYVIASISKSQLTIDDIPILQGATGSQSLGQRSFVYLAKGLHTVQFDFAGELTYNRFTWMHPDGERVASDNVSENITEDAMWRTYRPLGSLVFH